MNAEDPTLDRAEPPVVLSEEVLTQLEAELDGSEGGAARRAAESRLLEILRADGFTGPRFERLYEGKMEPKLVGYAFKVIRGWVAEGRIFTEALKFRQPIPKNAQDAARLLWTPDEQHQFTSDSILGNHKDQGGVDFFLEYGLRQGHWDPAKGASASSYFVGSCVCCFAKICNEWWKRKVVTEGMFLSAAELEDEQNALINTPDPAMGPEELAAVRDEANHALARVKDPQLREVLRLRSLGYTQAQGAAEVGLTAKAAERRLHAHRQSLRGQDRPPEQNDDGKGRP